MGHENVSTSVTWTLILLAEHPACQERVRREVVEAKAALVLARGGGGSGGGEGEWTAEALSSMTELTHAFHEATRLYPSVPVVTRQPTRDTELLGYRIPAGQEVVLSTYSMHRDVSVYGPRAGGWQLPERCPVVTTHGPPDAFPFGGGGRACIGRPLSYVEVRMVVAEILLRFRVVSVSTREGKPVRPVREANFVSLRPGPHKLRFEPLLPVDSTVLLRSHV